MTWLEKLLEQHTELESPTELLVLGRTGSHIRSREGQCMARQTDIQSVSKHLRDVPCESRTKKRSTNHHGEAVSPGSRWYANHLRTSSSIQGILKELGTAQTQPGGKSNQ